MFIVNYYFYMKFNLVLNHIIRILLVSLLCIMLFIGSIFVIPPHFAFADELPTFEECFNYSSPGYNNGTTYDITSNSLICNLKLSNYNGQAEFRLLNSDVQKYEFDVSFSSSNYNSSGSNSLRQVFWTAGHGEITNAVNCTWSGSSVIATASSGSFHYKQTSFASNANNSARFYASIFDNTKLENDLEFAFSSFSVDGQDISLGGGGIEPKQAIITIEPGYVAYIGVTGGNAIFTATFNKKQPSGSINSNIRYAFSSSRPPESSSITMDSSVGNMIPFVADRPFDIWGKSYNGRYGMADLSASYLIVYVPLTDPDGNTNATVKVALSQYLTSVQFPLSASMVGGDIVSTGNSDEFYISDSSMLNEDFRPEYVYSNAGTTSTAITIPVGGNNLPPTTGGGSLIEQFTSLLSDLINRIESLLIAPVEYIKWIISSSSNFMAWLSAIWTWLPEPVYTTIVSVLLILVVVGALKLLWR